MKKLTLLLFLSLFGHFAFADYNAREVENEVINALWPKGFHNITSIEISNPDYPIAHIAEWLLEAIFSGDQELLEVHFTQEIGPIDLKSQCEVSVRSDVVEDIFKCTGSFMQPKVYSSMANPLSTGTDYDPQLVKKDIEEKLASQGIKNIKNIELRLSIVSFSALTKDQKIRRVLFIQEVGPIDLKTTCLVSFTGNVVQEIYNCEGTYQHEHLYRQYFQRL